MSKDIRGPMEILTQNLREWVGMYVTKMTMLSTPWKTTFFYQTGKGKGERKPGDKAYKGPAKVVRLLFLFRFGRKGGFQGAGMMVLLVTSLVNRVWR